jgi:predicted HicB family RNase H-like nuclease
MARKARSGIQHREPASVTLLPDVRREASQLALEKGVSLSQLIERCLVAQLERHGRPVPYKVGPLEVPHAA